MIFRPSNDPVDAFSRCYELALCSNELRRLFSSDSVDIQISRYPLEGYEPAIKSLVRGAYLIDFRGYLNSMIQANTEFLKQYPDTFYVKVTPL